jgi:hypothetical protein
MPSQNVSFRAPYPLINQIQARDPKGYKYPGAAAKRDLERWYNLLSRTLDRMLLAPAEAVFLIRVVGNADLPAEEVVQKLHMLVEQDRTEGYGHIRRKLIAETSHWHPIQCWAVVDAVERYQIYQQRHPEATLGMALHMVGLHNYQATQEELSVLEGVKAAPPEELGPLEDD